MDELTKVSNSSMSGRETTVTNTKRVDYPDGSYEEIRVEQVEGGFIKTTTKHYKDDKGDWQWKDSKSVHTENPLEESSLIDKLEKFLNGRD